MATIYSSDIDKGHKQVKMSIAAKNTHNRTSNLFFTKSKAAMSESLKRDLASIKSIKWK